MSDERPAPLPFRPTCPMCGGPVELSAFEDRDCYAIEVECRTCRAEWVDGWGGDERWPGTWMPPPRGLDARGPIR